MPAEKVFDEQGVEIPADQEFEAPEVTDEEVVETDEEESGDVPEPNAAGKYRIGDKEFATQEEALAYATSQVQVLESERQLGDAYRQGIQDALQQNTPNPSVTPAAPEDLSEKFFADPTKFVNDLRTDIKKEVRGELDHETQQRNLAEKIWGDFATRHPDLADFREDIEHLALVNQKDLILVNKTKGINGGYDFLATKMRAKFAAYKDAQRPRRQLPNGGGGPSPTGKQPSVTPAAPAKKPLSFMQQVRSIKKQTRR